MNHTKRIYADLVPQIVSMRRDGKTAQQIADAFNERGQCNQYGKPWTIHLVRIICKREYISPPVFVKDEAFYARIHKAQILALEARRLSLLSADAAALPIALELLAQNMTFTAIASALNARNVLSPRLKQWGREGIAQLLARNGKLASRESRRTIVRTPRMIAAAEERVDRRSLF